MKYLIYSDIHGSSKTLKIVLDYFNNNNFDKMLVLGDLIYHGPRNDIPDGYNPKELIKMINPYKDKIIMVRGNCEAEVDQMVLDFHIYKEKKLLIDNHNFYLVHGHHLDKENNDYIKGDIVLYGHTHVLKCENINGVYYINPGSITLPKENNPKTFMTLEKGVIKIITLEGKIILEKEIY